MKRKIDKIKNKRLVIGGSINNLSPNEILVEQKGDTISLKERVNGEIKEVSGSGSSNNNDCASFVEYLDISNNIQLADVLIAGATEMKATIQSDDIPIEIVVGSAIAVYATIFELKQTGATIDIIALAYNKEAILKFKQGEEIITQTAYEKLENSFGGTLVEAYNNLPRITKEQFYSLE